MTIRQEIWRVGDKPTALNNSVLVSEQQLEDMIVAEPEILSPEWMLIGRQENTGYGGRIDLLAIAPDASLVLIEIKRDRTPREVVAQAIDYAGWVEGLEADDIADIYRRFSGGGNLERDFVAQFGQPLDEESLNESHQIIIVAASLDNSSERIVRYLSDRDVAVNVLCFQVFQHGEDQLLSRVWLVDPAHTQSNAATRAEGQKEPWNGEFYVSFGDRESRSWEEAMKYGFVSAGGGSWYSKTLGLLSPRDRIWVRVPGEGFVGVGRVLGPPEQANSFHLVNDQGEEVPALDVLTKATYHREYAEDPEKAEYFVPVEWLQTVPVEKAVNEIGFFGNQNTVCKPTSQKWRHTIERLKNYFPRFGG